jgi:hypothetical protein
MEPFTPGLNITDGHADWRLVLVLRTSANTGEAIHCVNPAVSRRRVQAPAKEVASTDSVLQAL